MNAIQRRDEAFVRLVDCHQETLLRLCYVYLGDRELAKDAVQETFLKAYRAMDAFRGESSEKTWLIQIAINTCKSLKTSAWFRHHDRRVTPEDVLHTAPEAAEEDLDVMRDILHLPSKLKTVICSITGRI